MSYFQNDCIPQPAHQPCDPPTNHNTCTDHDDKGCAPNPICVNKIIHEIASCITDKDVCISIDCHTNYNPCNHPVLTYCH